MRSACRIDDEATAVSDVGRGIQKRGSLNVFINGRLAVHIEHEGYYPLLPKEGPDVWWRCSEGVVDVLINGYPAVGVGCQVTHPTTAGRGIMATGSTDVSYGGATMTMEQMARADALGMFDDAEQALERWNDDDRAKFKRWFGTDSEEARRAMQERFRQARKKIEDAPLVPDDDQDKHAHVYEFGDTVHLDERFWSDDRKTRASTLFHEGSHFHEAGPARGDDEGTPAQLQEQARDDPRWAMNNGPNWDGYAEDGWKEPE